VLGRCGEGIPHAPVRVLFKHWAWKDTVGCDAATDERGCIEVGSLQGIELLSLCVSCQNMPEHSACAHAQPRLLHMPAWSVPNMHWRHALPSVNVRRRTHARANASDLCQPMQLCSCMQPTCSACLHAVRVLPQAQQVASMHSSNAQNQAGLCMQARKQASLLTRAGRWCAYVVPMLCLCCAQDSHVMRRSAQN
jgi:hypothetical protein